MLGTFFREFVQSRQKRFAIDQFKPSRNERRDQRSVLIMGAKFEVVVRNPFAACPKARRQRYQRT